MRHDFYFTSLVFDTKKWSTACEWVSEAHIMKRVFVVVALLWHNAFNAKHLWYAVHYFANRLCVFCKSSIFTYIFFFIILPNAITNNLKCLQFLTHPNWYFNLVSFVKRKIFFGGNGKKEREREQISICAHPIFYHGFSIILLHKLLAHDDYFNELFTFFFSLQLPIHCEQQEREKKQSCRVAIHS